MRTKSWTKKSADATREERNARKREERQLQKEEDKKLAVLDEPLTDYEKAEQEAEKKRKEEAVMKQRRDALAKANKRRAELAGSDALKRRGRAEREAAKERSDPWLINPKERENIDQQLAVMEWLEGLKATTNDTFMPLFFCQSRFLVLMGGAGSGKSIFVGRKILERVTTENGHRVLVCRKVARTLRDSCYKQLCSQLSQYYAGVKWSANKTDLHIAIENTGSEIIFAGLDDTEKLKSIFGITMVWIEEASEIEEADFDELNRRMRGETPYYKQVLISFNPISVTHWLKRRFFDHKHSNVTTHKSTYKDNRFLPDEDKAVLEAFKDTDPYQYQVYCLGHWGVTGKTVFDGIKVQAQLDKNIQPIEIGVFDYEYDGLQVTKWSLTHDRRGAIRIYKRPENGVPYVIGGDTAGEGSDDFVAQVIDNRTGEQVATLLSKYDEDAYARQVYCLGYYYNIALIGIETNFSTHPNRELERLHYPKLFIRDVQDDFRKRVLHTYGFRTDKATRPNLIATLVTEVRDRPENIVDRETLLQMQTFIRTDKQRAEAAEGAHDDCVMALGIAHSIRGQQSKEDAQKPNGFKVKWTSDMYEDYDNAGDAERQMLIERWGNPF